MHFTRPHGSVLANVLMIVVVVVCVWLASPWAAGLRAHLPPALPILVVVLGTLSGTAHVVQGLVRLLSAPSEWNRSVFSLLLGASGLLLALTFLPSASGVAPRTSTLWASAVCAILAAAMQRREHGRSER